MTDQQPPPPGGWQPPPGQPPQWPPGPPSQPPQQPPPRAGRIVGDVIAGGILGTVAGAFAAVLLDVALTGGDSPGALILLMVVLLPAGGLLGALWGMRRGRRPRRPPRPPRPRRSGGAARTGSSTSAAATDRSRKRPPTPAPAAVDPAATDGQPSRQDGPGPTHRPDGRSRPPRNTQRPSIVSTLPDAPDKSSSDNGATTCQWGLTAWVRSERHRRSSEPVGGGCRTPPPTSGRGARCQTLVRPWSEPPGTGRV